MRVRTAQLILAAALCYSHQAPAQQASSPTQQNTAAAATVVARLRQAAIPLRHVEAGNGFADLQPLKQIWKDVRIVGLGEITHGTREFVQMKHRLLEFLVREMGFPSGGYDVSPDGTHFVIVTGGARASKLVVALDTLSAGHSPAQAVR